MRLLINSEVKDELMTNFTMPRVPLLPSVKYKNRVQVVLGHFSQIHITQILTHHDDKQYPWSDLPSVYLLDLL